MRLAVLADIHGNLPALEAVTRSLEDWRPDYVVLAGDLINGAPFSVEVAEFVMERDWLVIRGNHEYYYLDYGSSRMHEDVSSRSRWRALHALRQEIPSHVGRFLATLPDTLSLMFPDCEPLRVLHGLPGDPRAGVNPEALEPKILRLLKRVAEHTLITAHTHIPVDCKIPRGANTPSPRSPNPPFKDEELRSEHWHVVNPGSVGLPLNGCSQAHFALLDARKGVMEGEGWRASQQTVKYDRERTLRAFFDRDCLETGGPINELFFWEVVSSRHELLPFFQWSALHGSLAQQDVEAALAAYKEATGRAQRIAKLDPTGCYAKRIG